jgi:asparagine synthase (glutamine-hydrolysing)
MCGIVGIYSLNGEPASPVVLRRMTDAIAHRGPDGEGFFVDGNVGLGHRRLAIIDLSPAAHQPMLTRDGRYTLTHNGGIYNYEPTENADITLKTATTTPGENARILLDFIAAQGFIRKQSSANN